MMNIDASVLVSKTKQKGKNDDDDDRVIDMFALVVYGTLVFSQSPRYVDAAVVYLIEQIGSQANPVPTIVVETIRSLNLCRREGKRNFIGCP